MTDPRVTFDAAIGLKQLLDDLDVERQEWANPTGRYREALTALVERGEIAEAARDNLRSEVKRLVKERDSWRDKAMFQQGRADEAVAELAALKSDILSAIRALPNEGPRLAAIRVRYMLDEITGQVMRHPDPAVKPPRMTLANEGWGPWKKFSVERLQTWLGKRGCYLAKDGVVVDRFGNEVKP